jgi:hypothetical protein
VADISAGALGCAHSCGFLHDRSLDAPRAGHVLHGVCIELHSRRVHVVGSTPHPDEPFMLQIARHLTDATDGVLNRRRFLICDRDRKWSTSVLSLLETSGVRVIRTPFRAPNCNVHAERFVRSVKEECPWRRRTTLTVSRAARAVSRSVARGAARRPQSRLRPGARSQARESRCRSFPFERCRERMPTRHCC